MRTAPPSLRVIFGGGALPVYRVGYLDQRYRRGQVVFTAPPYPRFQRQPGFAVRLAVLRKDERYVAGRIFAWRPPLPRVTPLPVRHLVTLAGATEAMAAATAGRTGRGLGAAPFRIQSGGLFPAAPRVHPKTARLVAQGRYKAVLKPTGALPPKIPFVG